MTETINLKENLFITTDTVPLKAKKMITSFIQFVSEEEAKWYVFTKDERFKDYRGIRDYRNAKDSLISAIKKITNKDVKDVRFTIYTLN